ncbi:hypothetical protein OG792_31670 [Micromonospora sp. NBC_01699]|uniref:hypothetical protein n=1 Tax=Micromonospora sp. NBC_01699 TaxID=2975984 RepID=UPI002E2C365D|nr:hypothetical protein [Micromonospora sp. NBC_01699]
MADPGDAEGTIGIQLLEAPADRRLDPRAHTYIIDHLAPGTDVERQVKIANRSDRRQRLQLYAGAATVDREQFRFAEGRTANELTSWVTLSEDEIDLDAGESAEVSAVVRVPAKASAGERYAVIWASATSAPVAGANVTKVHRVGIRLYLDIGAGGEPASSFDIGEFTAGRAPNGQASLTIGVRNTGGRALDMTGKVSLADGPGGVRAGPFDVVDGTTLAPGDSGSVQVALPRELPNGPWRAEAELSSGLVRHSAVAQITFPPPGGAKRTSSPMQSVTVLLAGALGVGLVVLLGLVLVLSRSRRHREPAAAAHRVD